ncbi:dephospho-CoA kinase [Furfurilactobacillus entadae]|uniref:dephospho-CoA kinase n=1 Tax=Furfurilactobacillus entadae TaxID=2922307 RepID=UPI0035ED85A6
MTIIIGLTGGIASGKSTVSKMLAAQHLPIVDADQVAHEVVASNTPTLAQLVKTFGKEILTTTGTLNRRRLGQLVFADPEKMTQLNAIIQPVIRTAIKGQLARLTADKSPIIVLDAPLLLEQHYEAEVDLVVVVNVPRSIQLQRLMARDQLTTSEATRRIMSQQPLAEKVQQADFVIDNSGSVEATRLQVVKLLDKVRQPGD